MIFALMEEFLNPIMCSWEIFISTTKLSNAQSPGTITDMKISEVKNGWNDVTAERLHRIMVARRKTGFVQPATLFLYPNTY